MTARARIRPCPATLGARLAAVRRSWWPSAARRRPAGVTLAVLSLAVVLAPAPGSAASDRPDPVLLETLKERLTAPPDCMPACVSSARLHLAVDGEALMLRLRVHAAAAAALPLPAGAPQWLPDDVSIDGEPSSALARQDSGGLWLAVPAGVHEVVLRGTLQGLDRLELPLPQAVQRVTAAAPGWRIDGIRADGSAASQLVLSREVVPESATRAAETSVLPPFARVERRLHLGLEWRVTTRVTRVSPPHAALALEIPLLPGETVTSAAVEVTNGRVRIDLPAGVREQRFESVLPQTDELVLTAPETTRWSEIWRADVSPLWHVELGGIAPVRHVDEAGRRLPTWQPWPGETVSLRLIRPAGVSGRTLTIERSRLGLVPGARATDARLAFDLRSSQGGTHRLELPAGAELQSVAIGGTTQPLRPAGTALTLPVVPGVQHVELAWRTPDGMAADLVTPAFDLGIGSVNASIEIELPGNRWVLLAGGPRLGPAVMFWGVLVVVALAAAALARVPWTPVPAWQWALLGLGLSQAQPAHAVLVIGWLLALGLRARLPATTRSLTFNVAQVALSLLTLAALLALFDTIRRGLLGPPDMQIAGNGSSAQLLRWYQDRAAAAYPRAWVWSAPLWVYRVLMLAWALWLAFALLDWLRFGWRSFTQGGLWRSMRRLATS